jgi:hypothetical protein
MKFSYKKKREYGNIRKYPDRAFANYHWILTRRKTITGTDLIAYRAIGADIEDDGWIQ